MKYTLTARIAAPANGISMPKGHEFDSLGGEVY
jgi:hypothetical protein